jgi:hypothetical protein
MCTIDIEGIFVTAWDENSGKCSLLGLRWFEGQLEIEAAAPGLAQFTLAKHPELFRRAGLVHSATLQEIHQDYRVHLAALALHPE